MFRVTVMQNDFGPIVIRTDEYKRFFQSGKIIGVQTRIPLPENGAHLDLRGGVRIITRRLNRVEN